MGATLFIGNRNYSSWSLRGWLLARLSGLRFDTQLIQLDAPESKARLLAVSPSGLVPCLHDGDVVTWDSLAIAEYLHERFPEAGIWPRDRVARAHARSVSAEMHSGFASLRRAMPMDIRAHQPDRARGPEVLADLARIGSIWSDCRARFGAGGPFLFGAWSGADCMYAPVVMRMRSYEAAPDDGARQYMTAVCGQADVAEWMDAAREEDWVIDYDAAGRPGPGQPRPRP